MYKETVKLIFRKFSRSRLYTGINIGGLAVAFAVALLVYSYVVKEWQTDCFHINGKNIYRATYMIPGNDAWYSEFCSPMGENAKKEIPGVKEFVRITAPQTFLVKKENTDEFLREDRCLYTDPQFFSMLTYPLVVGHIDAETEPGWAVISETIARKYFGESGVVGKELILRYPQLPEDIHCRIVAVMKDMPARSSLKADVLLDLGQVESMYRYSAGNALTTLLELSPRANVAEIAKAIPGMEGRYSDYEKQLDKTVVLQPLSDIYLHSGHIRDYEDVFCYGSSRFNYILCCVALLILLLSSCNYLMIKLAQLHKNGAAYAIQRCFGAANRHMRKQIYLEIGIHTIFSLGIAACLVRWLHPLFVQVVSSGQLYGIGLSVMEYLFFGGVVVLFTGAVGYVLSEWMLKRLDRNGIKNVIRDTGKRWDLKQVLLIGQMCIFCGLFFASLLLSGQMDFIRNKPMGYDNRNVLCVEWPGDESVILSAKDELMRHSDVLAVANGRPLPMKGTLRYNVGSSRNPERKVKACALLGDEDYLKTYAVRVVEGRAYRRNEGKKTLYNGAGKPCEAVINRKMVQELGLKNPIGEILKYGPSSVTVVGVVEDFHYKSLYQSVEPVIIGAHLPGFDCNLSIRYRNGKRQEVLNYLHRYFKENYMGILLQYSEYSYTNLYAQDIALDRMIRILTVIAILISAMGILAFSMFVAEGQTKEIALRKINGATEWQVVKLLNSRFVMKTAGACLIGLPLAYMPMKNWLQGFAYRIHIDWWFFGLSVCCSLLFVLSITTWQTCKAAGQNPVDVLKKE